MLDFRSFEFCFAIRHQGCIYLLPLSRSVELFGFPGCRGQNLPIKLEPTTGVNKLRINTCKELVLSNFVSGSAAFGPGQ
jgi:hypothetical protein